MRTTSTAKPPVSQSPRIRGWAPYLVAAVGAAALLPAARTTPDPGGFPSRLPGGNFTVPAGVPDVGKFAREGDALLSGAFHEAYHTSGNAAGPLQCVLDRMLAGIAQVSGWGFVSWAMMFALLCLIAAGAGALGRQGRRPWWGQAGAVFLAALSGLPVLAWNWGHWWQIPVAFAWWWAARQASDGRWVSSGILLAGTMALEPWGVLGVIPVLMLSSNIRCAVKSAATSMLGVLAWLPAVVVAGPSGLAGISWAVLPSSVWSQLGITQVSTGHRIVQVMVIVGVAAIFTGLVRRRQIPTVWAGWFVVLATLLLRLATDNIVIVYYWQTVAAALACSLVLLLPGAPVVRGARPLLAAMACLSVPFWIPWLPGITIALDPFTFLAAGVGVAVLAGWVALAPRPAVALGRP